MIDHEIPTLLDYDEALNAISSLSAAIAYASITGRIDQTVNMSHTLVQLVHALTDNTAVAFTVATTDESLSHAIGLSIAASVYISKLRYDEWVQEDSKHDS